MPPRNSTRPLTVVHSSDLHVDTDWTARSHGGDGAGGLRAVLDTARAIDADVILLAGDVFDHNRLPIETLQRTAALLAAAGRSIVILPGNHDPAVDDSAWHRGDFAAHGNIHILGVTDGNAVAFPHFDLEVCGRPHRDYDDMVPFTRPRKRGHHRRITMAHGHYQPMRDRSVKYHPGWLIHDRHIIAADSDYMALGHWNRPARVGPDTQHAYYCGSPELAGTVNVVRFQTSGAVRVRREPIRWTSTTRHTAPSEDL
jgi:DNA repair exonuclease SbcCD nuclease subunit